MDAVELLWWEALGALLFVLASLIAAVVILFKRLRQVRYMMEEHVEDLEDKIDKLDFALSEHLEAIYGEEKT